MRREAIFDGTGHYRYLLRRIWDADGPRVVFVMLNPSTADSERDDPTIRRCIGLARSWGFGSLEVVNLFAYRTPKPNALRTVEDPVGPENDRHLVRAVGAGAHVVVAWGNAGALFGRGAEIMPHLDDAARAGIYCLGWTRANHPRHPLFVPAGTVSVPWRGGPVR